MCLGDAWHSPNMSRPHFNNQTVLMRQYLWIPLFVLALNGCSSLLTRDMPKVDVAGIESLPGLGMELRLAVKLRVLNPSETSIEYNGLFVEMDVQGKSFASGVSDQSGSVPRYGESIITIPITISALSIVRQAINLAGKDRVSQLTYEIRGKIAGPVFNNHRFSSQGEFKLPAGMGGAEKIGNQ